MLSKTELEKELVGECLEKLLSTLSNNIFKKTIIIMSKMLIFFHFQNEVEGHLTKTNPFYQHYLVVERLIFQNLKQAHPILVMMTHNCCSF